MHQARVDEKGRLKLNSVMKEYLGSFPSKHVFVTTTDLRTARLYPISTWEKNESLFEHPGDDHEAAADIAFVANHYGAEVEMDKEGRVTLPSELRHDLDLENQPVWLEVYKGRVNIYGQKYYEERKRRATENLVDKNQRLEKRGFV
jgi:MraZ protein